MSRIVRIPEVLARVGVSRSTIYEWMRYGNFPRAIPLGARAIGWREADIEAWIADKAAAARHGGQREAAETRPAA